MCVLAVLREEMLSLTWCILILAGSVVANGNSSCNSNGTAVLTTTSMACDGQRTRIFLDGKEIGEVTNNNYSMVKKYTIPSGSKVFAISCTNTIHAPKILVHTDHVTFTGSKGWRCSSSYDRQWYSINYEDSSWSSAVVSGKNGHLPHGDIKNISLEAEWIKAGDLSGTLYCRRSLKCQAHGAQPRTCAYFHAKRVDDYKLVNHVFTSFDVRSIAECGSKCAGLAIHCLSFNYKSVLGQNSCQLNNSSQTNDPGDFIYAPGTVYYYKTEN